MVIITITFCGFDMIFKKKIIFIHAPKTGGNSLTHILSKYSNDKITRHMGYSNKLDTFEVVGKYTKYKHQNLQEYKNKLGKKFYDYKIITISRNPVDRLLSIYYMPDFHLHPNWFVRKINHFTKKKFNFFLFSHKFYKYKKPKFNIEVFKNLVKKQSSQSSFFYIDKKFFKPHFIFKYENYNNEIKKMCKLLDVDYKKIWVNKSPPKKINGLLKKKLKKIILNSAHSEDLKNFGYRI